jgi:hypothetical protein
MGGGSYSYDNAMDRRDTRSVNYSSYYSSSREEKFSRKTIDPEMDPLKFDIRESRDSEEHPESYPIIIALDETGSMGRIPDNLITHQLPKIMKKIIDAGIPNPQVCFMGIGDCQDCIEDGPIQVGQFESSDLLMEKWLKNVYLEGRGGGNGGEDYQLAWYIAARRMSTDSWEKRHKKGCLITIGDEPVHGRIPVKAVKKYLGDGAETDISTEKLLEEVRVSWDVYHIHCEGSKTYSLNETNWEELIDYRVVKSEDKNANDISNIIPALVISSYNSGNAGD